MIDKKTTKSSAESKGISLPNQDKPASSVDKEYHEIKIKGQLEEHWSDWLGGLEISHDGHGNSLLTGVIPDQAALHGILTQIRDLGLALISITPKGNDGAISEGDDENVKRSSE